jgi:hypothetical protein
MLDHEVLSVQPANAERNVRGANNDNARRNVRGANNDNNLGLTGPVSPPVEEHLQLQFGESLLAWT